MILIGMKRHSFVLAVACAIGFFAGPSRAAEKPQPIKVGATTKVTLEADGSKDYVVSLGKGAYRIVWDARRVDGESSNIIGHIRLLKPNGSVIDSGLLNFNEVGVSYRVGTVLNVAKPFVARLRLENNYSMDNWLTIVPVAAGKRVPFGWGATITPARISSDNGVGGTIEPKQTVLHSITLPKGKWSISLGFTQTNDEKSNLIGTIDLLDTLGFTKQSSLVVLNEIDKQARKEGVLNVTKPTPYILRVTNGASEKTYTYDVTIEPAS